MAALSICIAVLGLSSCRPRPTSGEFNLLAYNVAGLPQEISQENPQEHIPMISPLLNDFDVVMTQEDFDWWRPDGLAAGLDFIHYHERLIAQTTHEFRSEQHPGFDGIDVTPQRIENVHVGDGLAFLSRFPIEGNIREPWIGCFGGFDVTDGGAADCLAIKGFSVTRLQLADGIAVDLYNLHGEAGSTAWDQALQELDYDQLAEFMLEHSAGNAVIVGGDTNLHTDPGNPDTAIWQEFLSGLGLSDACDATDCPVPGRIDKVAYRSGGGVALEANSHEFLGDRFRDPEGEPLSDHEPLEIGFTWRRAG